MIGNVATLETDRLIMRRPNSGDWEPWRAFMMSERSRGNGGPRDIGNAWRGFACELGHWEIHGFGMWSLTLKGSDSCVGMVGAWCPADWPENEIGWMIFSDDLEGTGIAFEAAQAAISHAWTTLKWDTIVSYIADWNTRSVVLAERLGAVRDANAPNPRPDDPCLVFRHPEPEVSQ